MSRLIGTLALVTLALGACKDSNDPSFGPPANLLVQSGAGPQVGVFGQAVPTAPTVLVTDASNRPVPGASVSFAIASGGGTLNSTTQTTSSIGTASVVWTLGNTFGPKTLTATVAGLPPVTFSATATAPTAGVLAFNIVDPAGDTLTTPAPGMPKAIDLVSIRGDFKGDSLIVTATFSEAVTSGSTAPNAIAGFLEFDIDDNTATGSPPLSNTFGATANIRVEYVLTYFTGTGTTMSLSTPTSAAPVASSFNGNTVVVRIPMSLLGDDDGNFTIVGVFGTIDRPTDVVPNAGQTTVRRGIGISSTMNVIGREVRNPVPRPGSVSWRALAH